MFRRILPFALLFATHLTAKDRWRFVVSGDSRNCGDTVMPEIAAATAQSKAKFYWHLGDFRAIYAVDEDYAAAHHIDNPKDPAVLAAYQQDAWDDFKVSQLQQFGKTPVYLALGNHEVIPPKTHDGVVTAFSDWFNAPAIRKQRKRDRKTDTTARAYYHWKRDGIDFITLDNSNGQFDGQQLEWIEALLQRDASDASIRALVVGMHEALPESIAKDHSMSSKSDGEESGAKVYHELLDVQQKARKPVYTLASHSHFYMAGIFNTPYWHANGGILPGWIIGTAGAVRYRLPANAADAQVAKAHIYGYMIGHVTGDKADPVHFEFHEVDENAVRPDVTARFTKELVHWCWVSNPPLQ